MPKTIQLTLFRDDPAAAIMLHLARGQLNRAYHRRGLPPPDSLGGQSGFRSNHANPDDPLADGLEQARANFAGALAQWEAEMPADLISPILDILQRTYTALTLQPGSTDAQSAVLGAVEILKRIAANEN